MAVAQTSFFSTKLKLDTPLPSMIENCKFLRWSESNSGNEKTNSSSPIYGVLRTDPNCFILYWRDWNQGVFKSQNSNNNINGLKHLRRNDKEEKFTKTEVFDISCIRDVKTGKYASVPKDKLSREYLFTGKANDSIQDRTLSIYYGYDFFNIQIINFVTVGDNSIDIAKTWSEFLLKCITNQRMQNLSPWDNLLKLRSCLLYGKAVVDNKNHEFKLPVQTFIDTLVSNGKSGETERQDIIESLHSVGLPSGKNDYMDEKTLTVEKFYKFFMRIVTTRDIDPKFSNYKEKKDATKHRQYLNAEDFENFLNKEQRDPSLNELLYPYCTLQKATELIQKFEIDDSFRKKKKLSAEGLMRYLMDFENEVVDPVKFELHDDMDQPLTHYFINSSHNTYLTGHQITGKSDAEMYRQVLLSGCRCIELDCHEDDNQDEPIITHGRTFCTKILFSDAIKAIHESAFKTSPYPVLLSFENYCRGRMQEKMVKYLKEILGNQLLIDPLPDHPLNPGVPLPSPEQLKYKILVKFRKKRSDRLQDQANLECINESLNFSRSVSVQTPEVSKHSKPPTHHFVTASSLSEPVKTVSSHRVDSAKIPFPRGDSLQTDTDSSDSEKEDDIYTKRNLSTNLSIPSSEVSEVSSTVEMSYLVNYLQPSTFRSFEICQRKNRSYEMYSFVETAAINLLKEKSTEFVNYNKRQFSRIYPRGSRISSDNFIPQIFWNVGCQMVALNFQTLDTGMQLNLGKFEYNNRCGYILKPEIMRRTDVNKFFDPLTDAPVDGIVATTLKIRIISGIFLNHVRGDCEKRIGQTVTVELYGLSADSVRAQKSHRVKASTTKLFRTVYSDPTGYRFKKIIMPQLALLKVTVYDEQNKMIGHRVLPVVGLRPGYRYISLKNEANQQLLMTSLYVHIELADYVPEEYEDFASALVNPISYVSKISRDEIVGNLIDDNENVNSTNGLFDMEDDVPDLEHNSKISKSSTNLNIIEKELKNLHSTNYVNLKPRENRFSLSVEKFKLGELVNSKSLSNSLFNIPRSHSVFYNDNDLINTKHVFSLLNDPSLFVEIDLENLKNSKTNQHAIKTMEKKCHRLEKDAEKKIKELDEHLMNELERQKVEASKQKVKTEKKRKLFAMKTSKSSMDFYDTTLKNVNLTTTEKYVSRMKGVYEEYYTKIKNIRLGCIETFYTRLEKSINEIHEHRIQQLKNLSEKEFALVSKQTHQSIKSKKKILTETIHDKEELARVIKKIEKESVTFAVNENSKLEDLMKIKQKMIKQSVDNCFNNLRTFKEKQVSLCKNEYVDKVSLKKLELDKKYLFHTALNPNAVFETFYSMHLSKSAGSLSEIQNDDTDDKKIEDSKNDKSCSSHSVTHL